jgi:hypothetical protein
MATNLEIVRDALGLLGVLRETEQPSADQGEHALRVLNEMLEQWQAEGVRVGQWPQSDLNATSPLAANTLPCVKAWLAIALSPYYGVALPPTEMGRAERLYRLLVRDAVNAEIEPADMSHLPGVYQDWDIQTDS